LLEKPDLYGDEMVLFVLDEFNTHVFQHRESAEIPRLDKENNSPYSKGTKC
jgi:hypothetical protein